ncbi:MAG TPA: BMC domain-containing protein [Thermoanaerobaculia bacterium]|nr:BMC domain-containing protein [Thermoanaerobaculia bacterium]
MADRDGPALALILLGDIPPGLFVLDALAKEAEVEVLKTGTIHCGRYLILFGGEVGPVERSWRRALDLGGSSVVDEVLLPHAEARVAPAIRTGTIRWPASGDTLGVLQAATPPVLVRAVDAALKGALVELVELRVGDGLGGKAIASLWGETHDVEAAIDLARASFERAGAQGSSTAVIPRADPSVREALGSGSRFFREFRG